mmetsp:Transcript_28205/g.59087  ORF Transcript_28205/g.59087 Transcript_28205/m.59087 type:complete len:157 (-) Transcript_28205:12-482(-)
MNTLLNVILHSIVISFSFFGDYQTHTCTGCSRQETSPFSFTRTKQQNGGNQIGGGNQQGGNSQQGGDRGGGGKRRRHGGPQEGTYTGTIEKKFYALKICKTFSKEQRIQHNRLIHPQHNGSPHTTSHNSTGTGVGNSYGQNTHTQEIQQTSNHSST